MNQSDINKMNKRLSQHIRSFTAALVVLGGIFVALFLMGLGG